MTALNKQALREAAEKATPGRIGDRIDGSGSIKYECHGYDGSLVLRADHKDMEYGFIGDNGNADELFFRLCVPDVILSLLDENLQLQRDKDSLEAVSIAMRDDMREAREKQEAAERRNAELSESLKDLTGVVNTVNRSRHHEIKMDDDDDPCYWRRKEWIEYLMETVSAAEGVYRAAGIGVKGE